MTGGRTVSEGTVFAVPLSRASKTTPPATSFSCASALQPQTSDASSPSTQSTAAHSTNYDYAGQDPINGYDLDGLKKKKPRTPHPGPQAIASIAHVGNEVEANGYGTIAPDVKNPTG